MRSREKENETGYESGSNLRSVKSLDSTSYYKAKQSRYVRSIEGGGLRGTYAISIFQWRRIGSEDDVAFLWLCRHLFFFFLSFRLYLAKFPSPLTSHLNMMYRVLRCSAVSACQLLAPPDIQLVRTHCGCRLDRRRELDRVWRWNIVCFDNGDRLGNLLVSVLYPFCLHLVHPTRSRISGLTPPGVPFSPPVITGTLPLTSRSTSASTSTVASISTMAPPTVTCPRKRP
jgi:hypothetical protein